MPILYGADYNPEQWSPDVWEEDIRLMKLAHINILSLNIFSWALLEPQPNEFSFCQLDQLMNLLGDNDIGVNLGTATASPPTWMSRMYPEMLPVTADGTRMTHGSRQAYCPNSDDYRRKAAQLVQTLADRYKRHKALKMWHVNNEYACHVSACYCDGCAISFRQWLITKYRNLDALNDAWSTCFWSQRYVAWSDVLPPRVTPAQNNPSQVLDYMRFMDFSFLSCYLSEREILRSTTPDVPATTNFMANFKTLDYFRWAAASSVVAVDVYPPPFFHPSSTAITFDMMRSLKQAPFIVMEQSPSQVNWMAQNPHKRPRELRLQSLQGISRGADGIMYFQFRQSQGGAEKFHSAIVSHEGTERTRIFKQVAQIGAELTKLSFLEGWTCKSDVAIILDWETWWAVEYRPGPSDRLWYFEQISVWHRALHALNVSIDFVEPTSNLGEYQLVIAPMLYMVTPHVAGNLESFVQNGGSLLVTFFSGIVDHHDRVVLGGYPGLLRKLLGIYVEEFDPFTWEMSNEVDIPEGVLKGRYPCTLWGEYLHAESAEMIGSFAKDYYHDRPALTCNKFGNGKAWYLATQSEELTSNLTKFLCGESGVTIMETGVEMSIRKKDDKKAYFLLNFKDEMTSVELPEGQFEEILNGKRVSGSIDIKGKDVAVLLQESRNEK